MASISVVQLREKLKAQREPHWVKLSTGCFLGFRKMTPASTGTWLARYRDEDCKQQKLSLGEFSEMPPSQRYDAAKRAAETWFRHLGLGGTREVVTVRMACERYVTHLQSVRGAGPAADAEMRFKRWVYDDSSLARMPLAKLTRAKVEAWRTGMAAAPVTINRDGRAKPLNRARAASSVNRDIASVRAALNFAHDAGHVTTDMAWRVALRPTKNADGRRDVYLDRTQRRALIEKASSDVALLLQGLSLVPLRPGALAALTVGSLDSRLGVLTVGKDKAGRDRKIKVPPTTAALFVEQATDRAPDAPLLARRDGKPWNKDAWKWPIKAASQAANLRPETTAYAMRHSVITDLVTGGLDLLTVAQLSGTSVAMIERHYGHLRADHAAAALAQLSL